MNTYKAFYKNNVYEVEANTSYEAQKIIASKYNIKKTWEISIVLIATNNKQIEIIPAF